MYFFSSTDFKVSDLYFMRLISYVTVEEEMWTVQVNAFGVIMELEVKRISPLEIFSEHTQVKKEC